MKNSMSNFSGLALSRTEMKSVTGGCSVYRPPGARTTKNYSLAQTTISTFNDGSSIFSGLSRAEVDKVMSSAGGTKWCCASCSTASWM